MKNDDGDLNPYLFFILEEEAQMSLVLAVYSPEEGKYNAVRIPLDIFDCVIEYVDAYRTPPKMLDNPTKSKTLRPPNPDDISLKDFFYP